MPILLTVSDGWIGDVVYDFPVMEDHELEPDFSVHEELARSKFMTSLDVFAFEEDGVLPPVFARKFQCLEIERALHHPRVLVARLGVDALWSRRHLFLITWVVVVLDVGQIRQDAQEVIAWRTS